MIMFGSVDVSGAVHVFKTIVEILEMRACCSKVQVVCHCYSVI